MIGRDGFRTVRPFLKLQRTSFYGTVWLVGWRDRLRGSQLFLAGTTTPLDDTLQQGKPPHDFCVLQAPDGAAPAHLFLYQTLQNNDYLCVW